MTIPNVMTTQMVYSFAGVQHAIDADKLAAMVRPVAGNEVLLLCPSGEPQTSAMPWDWRPRRGYSRDSTAADVDGFVEVDEAGLKLSYALPAAPDERLLTIDGVTAVLGPGARATPTVSIGGEVFRSSFGYPLVGVSEIRQASFKGLHRRTIGAGRAVVLQMTFSGDGTVPFLPWSYELGTTDTAPTGGELVPQTIGGRYPLVALYGRVG